MQILKFADTIGITPIQQKSIFCDEISFQRITGDPEVLRINIGIYRELPVKVIRGYFLFGCDDDIVSRERKVSDSLQKFK